MKPCRHLTGISKGCQKKFKTLSNDFETHKPIKETRISKGWKILFLGFDGKVCGVGGVS
jgi:hypothetical protein